MRKYRNPKLEELEKYYDEDFLKAVDDKLQLFLPTIEVYPFYDGIQIEYAFNNQGCDYIEVNFFPNGVVELFHNYEDPDTDVEYGERFSSTNVEEMAEQFQEIISKINIYS